MEQKVAFKIFRDKERRPTVTICEITREEGLGIGTAIRSLQDNPVERLGKVKAFGRAVKALTRRTNSMPVQSDKALASMETLTDAELNEVPMFKSIFDEEP